MSARANELLRAARLTKIGSCLRRAEDALLDALVEVLALQAMERSEDRHLELLVGGDAGSVMNHARDIEALVRAALVNAGPLAIRLRPEDVAEALERDPEATVLDKVIDALARQAADADPTGPLEHDRTPDREEDPDWRAERLSGQGRAAE